jgi:hypothetical protein
MVNDDGRLEGERVEHHGIFADFEGMLGRGVGAHVEDSVFRIEKGGKEGRGNVRIGADLDMVGGPLEELVCDHRVRPGGEPREGLHEGGLNDVQSRDGILLSGVGEAAVVGYNREERLEE